MIDTKAITNLIAWKAENPLYRDWNIFTLSNGYIRIAMEDRGFGADQSVTVERLQDSKLDLLAIMVADCIKILKERRP